MSYKSEFSELDDYAQDIYTDEYYYEESALDVWNNCVRLSIFGLFPVLIKLLTLNFGFACLLATGWVPVPCLHILTGVIGIYLITTIDSASGVMVFFGCWTMSFLLIYSAYYTRKYFNCLAHLKIILIVLLVLCEYYLIEPDAWLQVRGVIMMLVMKVISLAEDISSLNSMPSLIQYFGYTLSGANILFGPWISFNEYLNIFKTPVKNVTSKTLILLCAVVKAVATSLLFLTLSNCWGSYFIPDESNRWLIAYKEAFTFRTSHYFVSYLSEAGMLASGFTTSSKKDLFSQYRYVVTEPLDIEFPSSLSIVVRKWNRPMHDFLKKYVYQSWLGYGRFHAILATFLISSFLHGFELKVSLVLISIGVFSYLQVAPRARLADIFDCCVKVRPCKDCRHKYTRDSLRVKVVLFIYSLATMFHLAYLGVLMDPSTDEVGVYKKWQHLFFISHIIMFFNVLIII